MTVEDENVDPSDPYASPLAHFGSEVKLERERLDLKRPEFAKKVSCSPSLVAKIETGNRVPGLEFAEACDQIFPHANGRFVRLWPLALRYAFPPWFRRYAELEWVASAVRMFNPQLVPGLVQTEEYARAVLRTARPTNLDDLVTARIERQRILTRDTPTKVWIILDVGVLTRTVGNKEVMRGQLTRLRDLAETPPHRVQIIPDKGRHHGWASPFGMLSFPEGKDVVHVDGFPKGYLLAEADDVQSGNDAYDLLNALALSPDESAPVIDSIIKDHYS
ncbi:helix-turn-helix transcriptional regulator [Streptomyces sp. NPDC051907]|uniref:helix-turn-helix domain-containing protein n=1 Tax=Streptomyces sp. NPDC051907 TaxID=3155284 RepID=UPI00343B15D7